MKSASKSVLFYNGQMELEMQLKMNRIVAQCKQKCELMQQKFTEKLEQVHTDYQKMAKKCQMMEKEIESLSKDKQELQEKLSEKSRQKRKLDEMYDQLRSEYERTKCSSIQPMGNFYRTETDNLFEYPANMLPNRKDWSVFIPETPGPKEDIWPASERQTSSKSGNFEVAGGSPIKSTACPVDMGNRRDSGWPNFGAGDGRQNNNPSMTLRNLILSPLKRPQLSRNHPYSFTL